jgi:leader peptidase (prepilin peptidase) / N-methyltransferase
MTALLVVNCAVIGLMIGSFLNVVVYRVPAGRSIVQPPSACASCDTRLTVLDLVPVLSWVALRGRCRHCGAAVSARYAMVELLTCSLFALTAWRIGWTWALPAYLVFAAFLVVLSFIDLDTQLLPRKLVYAAGACGLVSLIAAALLDDQPERIQWAAIGAAGVLVAFLAIYAAAKGGFGFGDVRLGAVLGWYLGWQGLPFAPVGIFAGFLLGSVVGVALMASGRAGRRTALPFGPFLAAGALVVLLAGRPFVDTVWPL